MQQYKGLYDKQVLESRTKYGTNDLTPPARESWVKLLLGKFNDPIIKLLLFATLLSFITGYFHGSIVESLGILLAVFLATFISFINEYKAGKEFDILNRINDTVPVKVYRNGAVTQIPKNELVVGDIVIVTQGDEIPADGKLLETMELSVNESSLNGESVSSRKTHFPVKDFAGTYSPNFIYRGTTVTEGDGIMEVTAVGDATEIGKTARQAAELTGAKTPLNRQLDKLSGIIGKVGFTVAGLTFLALVIRDYAVGILTFSFSLENLTLLLSFFMIAVTLIVVAVPEGLAMSVTLSLAYSMRKMTAGNTLVRKMHACETMGATTVICTDKTGTLTQNKMLVQYYSGAACEDFVRDIALNSTALLEKNSNGELSAVGNPTEGALLLYLAANGFSYEELRMKYKVVKRLPFSTERKYMATIADFDLPDKVSLLIKGAPEIIFSKCSNLDVVKELEKVKEFQQKGMRSLAFASIEIPLLDADKDIASLVNGNKFNYNGFVAIADPIRDDVPAAMKQCTDAGIAVKIVTGDTSLTAIEIARQAGLWKDGDTLEKNHITGTAFSELDDAAAAEAALNIKVMSRARPADKMRLVKLLQQSGQVVSVTGDGTNDAPALNYADVGLAMGTGTAVAKEASDIILLDDSFASVTSAVRWGRSIYLNIQKFIQFQLTINVVALFTALTGPFIGIEFPLTVTQMLWVNLIMDTFAALALASEPSYKEVMKKKPRGINDFIISKSMMANIFGVGLLFLAILLGILVYMNKDGIVSVYELSVFFTIFVMMQFWNMFNARTLGGNRSAFYKLNENRNFVLIAVLILVLQIVIIHFGGGFFRTEPLSLEHWAAIIAGTSMVLWIGELCRLFKRIKENRQ
ncbi:MAG: calcium-translocating P-type ATPase, PMCA-type [Bacteroidales bacterium]|nr:calcium-translocating P-type ATPase, PMCA-type [Bacteroidales bacterium]